MLNGISLMANKIAALAADPVVLSVLLINVVVLLIIPVRGAAMEPAR
ncbi:MAG: hypothetical protein AAF936_13715 [Pseudomonadota bacterium]